MAVNLNDIARVELVDKLAAKVAAKLNALNDTTFKAAKVDGNSLKFYTSTDTTGQAAETIDIPAEQFLDQASTSFVANFQFSALIYDGASNPNLDGKAVLVLGLKTKSNDGKSESISYSFVDVSRLVDTYTASDTSVTVTNYKIKANISADAGNTLKLKSNGLYAAGVTDTATTTAAGLMSAADKTKVNSLDVEFSKKLDSDATAVKATQLETARNIQTNLGSTTAGSFNGTASVSAGVTGTLGIANGGTGQTTAAGVRNTLGLGNTTGALPIANGGTGKNNLNDVTVGRATNDGAGNSIASTYVPKALSQNLEAQCWLPYAGAGSPDQADLFKFNLLKSGFYSAVCQTNTQIFMSNAANNWLNVLNCRHDNACTGGDYTKYGMLIYSPMTVAGNLYWRQQVDNTWQAEKVIIDSANISSYTAGSANYPTGFTSRLTTLSWGVQAGTPITEWADDSGGRVGFRKNCPSNGKTSILVDGYFYQNEGMYRCLDTSDLVTKIGLTTTASTVEGAMWVVWS